MPSFCFDSLSCVGEGERGDKYLCGIFLLFLVCKLCIFLNSTLGWQGEERKKKKEKRVWGGEGNVLFPLVANVAVLAKSHSKKKKKSATREMHTKRTRDTHDTGTGIQHSVNQVSVMHGKTKVVSERTLLSSCRHLR